MIIQLKTALAAAAGAVSGWDRLITVLCLMMAADWLSGVLLGFIGKSPKSESGALSSREGAKGLARKGLMLSVVLVAALLDSVLGSESVCRDTVCWFYIANEGLSLLENLNLAGVPFPEKLKQLLGERRDK